MTLPMLRDDALTSTTDGFAIRLSLPWIRSLPLAGVESLEASVDGKRVEPLSIELGARRVSPPALAQETGWWFLQDRLRLRGEPALRRGSHDVSVAFRLVIPYLQAGSDGPLNLPFRIHRNLVLDAPATVSISRDVA